jgi:phage FluMu protein Com
MITQVRCGKCNSALKFDATKLKEGVNFLKCSKCNSLNKIVRSIGQDTKQHMQQSFPKQEG